ncbi:hypothetical protein [Streptomyces sp. bgisy031]|uniref:hypothetical protein n=1 Tax=Streptomyces sp. bgisy031 TaxID=3413772 RepID=UPI003D715748
MSANFYQPGHTYADTDPNNDWAFRVDYITTHPENGELAALGWRHFKGEWEPYAYFADDWDIHRIAGFVATTSDEEKATAAAATATPTPFIENARVRALHEAMLANPGEWRVGAARSVLLAAGFTGLGRNSASHYLKALVALGLATAHGPNDGRYYTLSTPGEAHRRA